MADTMADAIATYLTAIAGISYLYAPYDDFNEGQKVLMDEYAELDIDVNVTTDWDFGGGFAIFNSQLDNCYVDFEVYHEEAFGDLLDKAEETARQYAEIAFNFTATGFNIADVKQDILSEWKSAADYVSRRIGIFA